MPGVPLVSPLFAGALLRALYHDLSGKMGAVAKTLGLEEPEPYVPFAERAAAEGDPRALSASRGGLQDVVTADCVVPECAELKDHYDRCFFEWYRNEYITDGRRDIHSTDAATSAVRASPAGGDGARSSSGGGGGGAPRKEDEGGVADAPVAPPAAPCAEQFEAYRTCLVSGLAKSGQIKLEDTRVTIPKKLH